MPSPLLNPMMPIINLLNINLGEHLTWKVRSEDQSLPYPHNTESRNRHAKVHFITRTFCYIHIRVKHLDSSTQVELYLQFWFSVNNSLNNIWESLTLKLYTGNKYHQIRSLLHRISCWLCMIWSLLHKIYVTECLRMNGATSIPKSVLRLMSGIFELLSWFPRWPK